MENLNVIKFFIQLEGTKEYIRIYTDMYLTCVKIEKDWEFGTSFNQVYKYLLSKGFNIIGHCPAHDGHYFISDTLKSIE